MNQTERYIDIISQDQFNKKNEVIDISNKISSLEKQKKQLMKEVYELGKIMVHLKQKEEEK